MKLQDSVRVAIAIRKTTQIELAEHIGMSEGGLCTSLKNGTTKFFKVVEMAGFFNMKVSEFIALGEDK